MRGAASVNARPAPVGVMRRAAGFGRPVALVQAKTREARIRAGSTLQAMPTRPLSEIRLLYPSIP